MDNPAIAITQASQRITGCHTKNQIKTPNQGVPAYMLLGKYVDTLLYALVNNQQTQSLQAPSYRIRWTSEIPNNLVCMLFAGRCAKALYARLGGELKDASCEQELSHQHFGKTYTGRADWMTSGADSYPIEIKTSDQLNPSWRIQLAHYIVASAARKGMLAIAGNYQNGYANTTVTTYTITAVMAYDLIDQSTANLQDITPGKHCDDCPVNGCIYNYQNEGD